jgi:hypothetical protein
MIIGNGQKTDKHGNRATRMDPEILKQLIAEQGNGVDNWMIAGRVPPPDDMVYGAHPDTYHHWVSENGITVFEEFTAQMKKLYPDVQNQFSKAVEGPGTKPQEISIAFIPNSSSKFTS